MACCFNTNFQWDYLLSPATLEVLGKQAQSYGTLVSGALFGAGWWFWADACTVSPVKVPFDQPFCHAWFLHLLQYIPGIIATLALIMINLIRREELQESDPFDDAGFCRPRFWLFLSYVISFAAIVGAVWVLLEHYANNPDLSPAEKWPGAAGIFQVVFILGSGLLLFVSRTPTEDSAAYGGYGAF